ncbi:hypothetical protein Tco_0745400 [Tanacetum coccineum]
MVERSHCMREAQGPKRTKAPKRVYRGGNADWFDDVDSDGYFVIEVKDDEDIGLETENVDLGTQESESIEPRTSLPNGTDNVREDNEGSFNNEDNGFEYGIEDRIDDVEVDMVEFRKYIDLNVEWVDCTKLKVENNELEDEEFELENFDSEIK